MIKKIIKLIKKYAKEIVLVLLGIIVSTLLKRKAKEVELSKKIEGQIEETEDISEKEKQGFREQLSRINGITDDAERMEAKAKLWEFLSE